MQMEELLNRDIPCECGKTHRCDIATVKIGRGALDALPKAVAGYRHILLVADGNTYPLCGERVKVMLSEKIEDVCLFDTTEMLVPDEEAIATVRAHLTEQTDLILGIGSGVINDLCKYVSFYRGIKSGIIATAPSMDGYASSGAAMILGGMKVTDTTHAPDLIVGDTELLKSAPIAMIRAGYGDIIGKYSSLCDWELANLVCGEHLCRPIYDLVRKTTDEIRDCAEAIAKREDAAIERLMEALVLIGMTLTLVETTRPGSGSEHHLSHFFEIVGLVHQEKHLSHGTDVAYNTILTAGMREQILALESPAFCEETPLNRLAAWKRIYGDLSSEVEALQRDAKSYETDLKPIYTEKWEEIRAILQKCPTAAEIRRMMEAVGLCFGECEATYGHGKICDAMLYGKDLKNRYSVLWLYYSLFSGNKSAADYKRFDLLGERMGYDFAPLERVFGELSRDALDQTVRAIESHARVFVYGAGRSGLMIKAFAMRLAQMGRTVFAVGEVVTPAIEGGDLLLLASASGETASVLRCAETARAVGATVYALTASGFSTLLSLSDGAVRLVAPTKDQMSASSLMGTLFEESVLLFGDAVINALGGDPAQMRARHANLE